MKPSVQFYTWHSLSQAIRELNKLDPREAEKQAWAMLKAERKGLNRAAHVLRIYGYAAKLRTRNEREEIFKGL